MPVALDSRSETRLSSEGLAKEDERFGFGRKPHGFRYAERRIPQRLLERRYKIKSHGVNHAVTVTNAKN